MARTERESDNRRREEKWQTLWCCRHQQRACRMAQASAEKLEHTGPAEKERVASMPQKEQLARTPEPPLPKSKGTEPSVQSTRSRGGRESRWARAAPLHQSTAASTWWCGHRPRLSWSKWLLAFPRVPVTPGTPLYLFAMLPPERPQQAAHSIYKIGRLFSLFLFSCPSLALLCLLILLLLLMSGNVHPNPGPIFPCSVCAGNVIWRGKSVQCCACSKWVHLRCSQLSLSLFRALGSSHSWSSPLYGNTVTPPSSDSFDMYTSTVQSSPASANAALSPHPRLQTS